MDPTSPFPPFPFPHSESVKGKMDPTSRFPPFSLQIPLSKDTIKAPKSFNNGSIKTSSHVAN